jgi:hypothetical protein
MRDIGQQVGGHQRVAQIEIQPLVGLPDAVLLPGREPGNGGCKGALCASASSDCRLVMVRYRTLL